MVRKFFVLTAASIVLISRHLLNGEKEHHSLYTYMMGQINERPTRLMMYDAERYTHRSIYYFQCLYIFTVVIYNKEKSLKRAALSFSFSFFHSMPKRPLMLPHTHLIIMATRIEPLRNVEEEIISALFCFTFQRHTIYQRSISLFHLYITSFFYTCTLFLFLLFVFVCTIQTKGRANSLVNRKCSFQLYRSGRARQQILLFHFSSSPQQSRAIRQQDGHSGSILMCAAISVSKQKK